MRTLILFLLIAANAFAGYDVHITRRKTWTDEKGPEITLQEWKDVVLSDAEMRLDETAETENKDGQKIKTVSEGLAVWINYSQDGKDRNRAWFYWNHGEIAVKNPDREIRRKMFRIAQKLGASVQGDEGEKYNEKGEQAP